MNDYEIAAKEVNELFVTLSNNDKSPHFALGYLESMLKRLAVKYPEVLIEIKETNDYAHLVGLGVIK